MAQSSTFLAGKFRDRVVSFYDFKGLIAPVFTCFNNDDERSLNFEFIDRYAAWLKSKNIIGVLVNGFSGEGYAMTANERKMHAEFWWLCAQKHDLLFMLHIGCCPLADCLEAARHADELGVHAVVCSPDVYRRPQNIPQLVSFCGLIAENCRTRPFFYHHIPHITNVEVDLLHFYDQAESAIPNFFGIHYSCLDLDEGARCLRDNRSLTLMTNSMLAPALLMGFEAAVITCVNICPELCGEIYAAMKSNDLKNLKIKQQRLSETIWSITGHSERNEEFSALKNWFNQQMNSNGGPGFSAGPTRDSF